MHFKKHWTKVLSIFVLRYPSLKRLSNINTSLLFPQYALWSLWLKFLIISCIFILPLTAQDTSRVHLKIIDGDNQTNVQIQNSEIDFQVKQILSQYHDLGFWWARFHYESRVLEDSIIGTAILEKGDIPHIKEIVFQGNLNIEEAYIKRSFMQSHETVLSTQLDAAESLFNRKKMGHISNREVYKNDDKEFLLSYNYKANPSVLMNAMLGYKSVTKEDSSNWVGFVKFKTRQIGGYPRGFSLEWEKLTPTREVLHLAYWEPWLFSTNAALNLGYSQEMINGEYVKSTKSMNGIYPLNWNQELEINYNFQSTLLTPSGHIKYPNQTNNSLQALGFSLNSYQTWQKGAMLKARVSILNKYEKNRNENITKLSGMMAFTSGLDHYYQYFGNISVLHQNLDNDNILYTDYIGGIHSIRGHYESQYRVDSYVVMQNEIRIVKDKSQFFVLLDRAKLNLLNKTTYVSGYGIGFRVPSGRQKIEILLATNPSLGWRNALLHLSYGGDIN